MIKERDLEELLVIYAAPTLAGIKTASLFAIRQRLDEGLQGAIMQFNRCFMGRGLRLLPMARQKGRTLLYLYRPDRLYQDLHGSVCRDCLCKLGYPIDCPSACIREYIFRLARSENFLHEIGFFLGYPSEDVVAFMEEGPGQCQCSGCWKVYSHVTEAKRNFQAIQQCKQDYYTSWKQGTRLEELVV